MNRYVGTLTERVEIFSQSFVSYGRIPIVWKWTTHFLDVVILDGTSGLVIKDEAVG